MFVALLQRCCSQFARALRTIHSQRADFHAYRKESRSGGGILDAPGNAISAMGAGILPRVNLYLSKSLALAVI
jgi:hypothetical protein